MLKGTYYTYWQISGTNNPSEYGDIRYYFKIYETVNSALINTSTMKVECYTRVYTHSDIYYGTNGVIPVKQRAMFNGNYQTVTGNAKVTAEYHKTYDTKIGDIYYTAQHNEDGSGTISNQNSGAINTSGSSYIYTTHQYIELTKITRGSIITNDTSSTSYKEFGTNVTFGLTRPVTEWTTDVYYKIGDTTYNVATGVTSESISYLFPDDLISNFPNNAEVSLTVYCKTTETNYTTQTTVYLKVPDTYIPTVDLTLTDTNTIAKNWGLYVKTKSILNGVVNASGVKGSTITGYSTSVNGETYNASTFTTSPLKNSGSQTIKTTVTDSRGRHATKEQTINVIDYYTPSISSYSVVRCLEDGTDDEQGTFGKVKCTYSIATVNDKNNKSLVVKCGDETKTFALSSYKGTFVATEYFSDLSIASSYVFEFYIVDSFNTDGIKYTFTMTPAYTTVSKLAGGKGVTFGQVATEEGFNCYMNADFKKNITQNGKDIALKEEIEKIESGSNDNGSWIKYPDGTMICRGKMTITSGAWVQTGSVYYYDHETPISFPQEFIDANDLSVEISSNNSAYVFLCQGVSYTASEITKVNLLRPTTTSNDVQLTISYMAIGSWKSKG